MPRHARGDVWDGSQFSTWTVASNPDTPCAHEAPQGTRGYLDRLISAIACGTETTDIFDMAAPDTPGVSTVAPIVRTEARTTWANPPCGGQHGAIGGPSVRPPTSQDGVKRGTGSASYSNEPVP